MALKQEIEGLTGGPHLHVLNKVSELEQLPQTKLKQLHQQLTTDLERLNKVIAFSFVINLLHVI